MTMSYEAKLAFFDRHFASVSHPYLDAVKKILLSSDYACRQVEHIKYVLKHDDLSSTLAAADYQKALQSISIERPSSIFSQSLRQFRHRHFLRLMLREAAGLSTIQETMRSWSYCADALILHALSHARLTQSRQYGEPLQENGQPAQLYPLALGKLGGHELNYSSDVDLIFVYDVPVMTTGEPALTPQVFFSKIVMQMVHCLQEQTVDGFVFRVDLRLRPYGESGPLVMSRQAFEIYYQEQGRDWERYALLKARLIASIDAASCSFLEDVIRPFVYRRYVDFSVIEALRNMKAMIIAEIKRYPLHDDIKRGRGGIREIEFIVQSLQLIRGGRIAKLQHTSTLEAIAALEALQMLKGAKALRKAYLFLRQVENALQAQNDKQTHRLPTTVEACEQLAHALGFRSFSYLEKRLSHYRKMVAQAFDEILYDSNVAEDSQKQLSHQLLNLWTGQMDHEYALSLLANLGFDKADQAYQMIASFRSSAKCRRLSQAVRMRLDKYMVLLLRTLVETKTTFILKKHIELLDKIVGRSAYLALLTENPQSLQELSYWLVHSYFITDLILNYPFLLEVLLYHPNWRPPSKKQLAELLQEKLNLADSYEQKDEILREFKLTYTLLSARAECRSELSAVAAGRFLSELAALILEQVVESARLQLRSRFPEIEHIAAHFAIVAYGKLGSQEMGYHSDLDLVFLHASPLSDEYLVTRWVQKILYSLTMRTQMGVLYSVDTRLRPSGEAGLLISPLKAYCHYQKEHAWTWEHQALLRARVICGSKNIRSQLNHLKKQILSHPPHLKSLRQDVDVMRQKMLAQVKTLEEGRGSLICLEFLIQYLVLTQQDPRYAFKTHTLSQMQALYEAGVLSLIEFKTLKAAYLAYHHYLHHKALEQIDYPRLSLDEVARIYDAKLKI